MFQQVLFILPPFHDRQQYNDKSTAFDTNMNKARFHNALALSLGYQRIVNDKRINIGIDDKQYPDDVLVSISIDGFSKPICYKASEGPSQDDMDCLDEKGYDDIKLTVEAVHHAYIHATTYKF